LESAVLHAANMQNIQGENVNFRHADLSGANLVDAVIGGSNLRDAIVTDADFNHVELASVGMEFANFSKAHNADIPSYKVNVR